MRLLDRAFPGSYASAQSAQRSETYCKVAIQPCILFHVFYRASLFCTPIGLKVLKNSDSTRIKKAFV